MTKTQTARDLADNLREIARLKDEQDAAQETRTAEANNKQTTESAEKRAQAARDVSALRFYVK